MLASGRPRPRPVFCVPHEPGALLVVLGQASNDLVEIDKRNMGEPNRIEDCMELIEANLEVRCRATRHETLSITCTKKTKL